MEHLLSKGIPDRKIVVIHNGIDTDEFRRDGNGETFERLSCFPKDGLTISYVGRLSSEKGIKTLLEAMKNLVNRHDGLRLAVIGEGPLGQYLESYSRKLGLEKCVIFTGHIDDIKNVYRQLDLLVLPSETEGMPNVVLEALAMEVPVVATNVGGVPEIIKSGSNGILVEPRNVEGLTEAIGSLIMDGKLRKKFALEGRRTVCERFSFEQRMRKEEEVYRQLVS
jgi:glycosyltransferase involved in cell wall biosynthesis